MTTTIDQAHFDRPHAPAAHHWNKPKPA